MDYKLKYLKYKNKYLQLQKMVGGYVEGQQILYNNDIATIQKINDDSTYNIIYNGSLIVNVDINTIKPLNNTELQSNQQFLQNQQFQNQFLQNPGQSVPGQPGQSVPGQPVQLVPGQPVPGQPVSGQPVPGQLISGQPVPDETVPVQPVPDQLV